jgi:hypothetical protein
MPYFDYRYLSKILNLIYYNALSKDKYLGTEKQEQIIKEKITIYLYIKTPFLVFHYRVFNIFVKAYLT